MLFAFKTVSILLLLQICIMVAGSLLPNMVSAANTYVVFAAFPVAFLILLGAGALAVKIVKYNPKLKEKSK